MPHDCPVICPPGDSGGECDDGGYGYGDGGNYGGEYGSGDYGGDNHYGYGVYGEYGDSYGEDGTSVPSPSAAPTPLAESNEGVVVASGTLDSGSEGFDWLCLADGCYELTVGGGSADSEIGFEFLDEVRILNYVVLSIEP